MIYLYRLLLDNYELETGGKMNVYDFDQTIYQNDSSVDFYKYCLRCYPEIARLWPKQMAAFIKYQSGEHNNTRKTEMKSVFFSFVSVIDDIDETVRTFLYFFENGIKKWYLDQQREDDLIISASPEFLLQDICGRLGIKHLIASDVDKHTGKFQRPNCHDYEKVKLIDRYADRHQMEAFYSDSYSDSPLAILAKEAYIVEGDEIIPWDEKKAIEFFVKHPVSELQV